MKCVNKKKWWVRIPVAVVVIVLFVYLLMPRGWRETPVGKMYYQMGVPLKNSWVTIDDSKYYLDGNGICLRDCSRQIDGECYFFDENGVVRTGFYNINNLTVVFLGEDGAKKVGWQTIGEFRYYFGSSGYMETGPRIIDGEIYLFDNFGKMQTDCWGENCGNSFEEFVEKYSDTPRTVYIYYFGSDGKAVTGWKWIDGYRYCFDANGRMYTGSHNIDGVWYDFGDDGKGA